jgi:hypothetical protein
MMLSNTQARNRIDAINELVANHRVDQERSQFKVTPYDVVKKGFIPEEYLQEYLNLMELKSKGTNDSPLTLQEQLSYGTYFAMHPEKVCGVMEVSSSGAFPVRVKGTRADVERVINTTLKEEKGEQENISIFGVRRLDRGTGNIFAITFWESVGLIPLHIAISFNIENEVISIGNDGYLNWIKATESINGKNKDWIEFTDKNRIRQYLDNPQIKEFLKAYYPKDSTQNDNPISQITLSNTVIDGECIELSFRDNDDVDLSVTMRIQLDEDGVMKFLKEKEGDIFQYRSIAMIEYHSYTDKSKFNRNSSKIREYLDNPLIKELLKDYYPKSIKYVIDPSSDLLEDIVPNLHGQIISVQFNHVKINSTVTIYVADDTDFKDIVFDERGFNTYKFNGKAIVNRSGEYSILKKEECLNYLNNPLIKELLKDYYPKEKTVLEKTNDTIANSKRQRRIRVATATAIALALAYNYQKD